MRIDKWQLEAGARGWLRMEAGLGERASTDFPSVRLGPVSLFCRCDFRGSKTLWFGFYLLLFSSLFGVPLPEGLPGLRAQFAAEALAGGRRKAPIEPEHLLVLNLRARKNPHGNPGASPLPQPGWELLSPARSQTEGVSAPSGGSSSSISSPRTPQHGLGLLHPSLPGHSLR